MSDTTKALCGHLAFEANVIVDRIEDAGRFVANVQVRCATCGIRFRWLGLEMGLHPAKPRVSVDEFELRAPIEPDGHLTSLTAGAETGFPSFQIRERSSPARDATVEPDRRCPFIASRARNFAQCGKYAGHPGPHTEMVASAFAQSSPETPSGSSPSPTPDKTCIDCGAKLDPGEASVFTVCEDCWNKHYRPSPIVPTTEPDR